MTRVDTTLAVTLGLIGLAVLLGWRFDWPSIRSRRLSVGFAIVVGLLAVAGSIPLVALSAMAVNHQAMFNPSLPPEARAPGWWPFYLGVLPLLVGIAFVALVSRRRDRLLVVAVGLATFVFGYAGVFGGLSVIDALAMVKPTYVNHTSQPISISHQKANDPAPVLDYPHFDPGERYYDPVGYQVEGDWIRIIARWPDGTIVFDRTYTWDDLRRQGGVITVTPPELRR